jgi:hypothetical protein
MEPDERMNTDDIVQKAFSQLIDEFELRKAYFLNVVHANIDRLAKHAGEWFGDEVPKTYTDILNSLINLTLVFYEQNRDHAWVAEYEYESFSPVDVFNEILDDVKGLLKIRDISIIKKNETMVHSARKVFTDSILNIFMCLSPYIEETTRAKIITKTEMSSVKIEIKFTDLSKTIPELSRLMKFIYSYYVESRYFIRIGMEIPFSSLKKIGAIPNASQKNENTEMTINLTLPSYEFLQTVSDIRNKLSDIGSQKYSGMVIVSITDSMLDMILRENLAEYGYTVKSYPPEKLKFSIEETTVKALIVEEQTYFGITEFSSNFIGNDKGDCRIIVIADRESSGMKIDDTARIIRPPFEIQSIVEIIEK